MMKKSKNKAPCIQEANEIQKKRGGELYILGEFPSQKYWHVVVKSKDKYYDATGAKSESQLKKNHPSSPLRKATNRDKEHLRKINKCYQSK